MPPTPVSLLERLRQPAEPKTWARFVDLYTPLLFYWARRMHLQEADAADLVQDVFTVLVQKLPEFHYDPRHSFRNWLRAILLNRWRDRCRRRTLPLTTRDIPLDDLAGPDSAEALGEAEYRMHLVGRALQLMQAEFEPTTWKACWEFVVAGKSAAEVAAELGVSADVVYAAKYRVLRRLRQEMEGLLD